MKGEEQNDSLGKLMRDSGREISKNGEGLMLVFGLLDNDWHLLIRQ